MISSSRMTPYHRAACFRATSWKQLNTRKAPSPSQLTIAFGVATPVAIRHRSRSVPCNNSLVSSCAVTHPPSHKTQTKHPVAATTVTRRCARLQQLPHLSTQSHICHHTRRLHILACTLVPRRELPDPSLACLQRHGCRTSDRKLGSRQRK